MQGLGCQQLRSPFQTLGRPGTPSGLPTHPGVLLPGGGGVLSTTDPITTHSSFRGRSQLVIFTCNSCFLRLLGSNQNPEASGHTLLACVGRKGPKVGLLGTHGTPGPLPLEGVLFARGGSRGNELGSPAALCFGNSNYREDSLCTLCPPMSGGPGPGRPRRQMQPNAAQSRKVALASESLGASSQQGEILGNTA